MDLLSTTWHFICLWVALYVIVIALKHFTHQKPLSRPSLSTPMSLLPTTDDSIGIDDEDDSDSVRSKQDEWTLGLFQVRYTTQRCNRIFRRLATAAPRFWRLWFSLGTVAATLTMVVGVLVITVAALKIMASFSHWILPGAASQGARFGKRSLDENEEQVFLPMIPGITLPISHLTYYLFALLICGVLHEAGHAIASYMEGVPVQSAGIFFYYIYPGAFVNIPDQSLQLLTPWRQLNIVCAGVWHNLVLYAITSVLLAGGLKSILLLFGWQSLEATGGVNVVDVRWDSPLALHLPPCSVIYQLDDVMLKDNIADWNHFLLDPGGQPVVTQGFCAAVRQARDEDNTLCCQIDDDHPFGRSWNASLSCFQDIPTAKPRTTPYQGCLTTVDVLASPHVQRCTNQEGCENDMRCVAPYTPSSAGQVVRVHAGLPRWAEQTQEGGSTRVFIFEGELVDIWESVKVSLLRPRVWFLPVSMPHMCELLLRYMSSFTLALALLNILPAFKLDGEFALEQMLTLALQRNAGSVTTRAGHRQTRRVQGMIVKTASVVVGFVIMGSLVLGLVSRGGNE